jgi:hypothetical protein
VGPIALFDKSFLQSLSVGESVFFDHFFLPVVCPIFYVETLADLAKTVRPGREPEDEVRIIADKFPEMAGTPCIYHVQGAIASLLGFDIPMTGQVPRAGGRNVTVDGKRGVVYKQDPEAEAFQRWQRRQFDYVEREFAKLWRAQLTNVDLVRLTGDMRKVGLTSDACKSLSEAKLLLDRTFARGGSTAFTLIRLALQILGFPQYETQILTNWRVRGKYSLPTFAPYAAHVLSVELFFQIAVQAGQIVTPDLNTRMDMAYLFYLPFCQVFISSDSLHRRVAHQFMRGDQTFVWGPDLKADLTRLMSIYDAFPEEEKAKGITRLAPAPPAEDNGLVVQLWDKPFGKSWRDRRSDNLERESDIVERVSKTANAPADESQAPIADPEFMQLTRYVSKRKGSWWQLPKDLTE